MTRFETGRAAAQINRMLPFARSAPKPDIVAFAPAPTVVTQPLDATFVVSVPDRAQAP